MNGEKDSYRHTWTYDLNGTSSGERSAFCEKSAVVYAFDWRARGRAWPARQPDCRDGRVRGRPGGGPVPLPLNSRPVKFGIIFGNMGPFGLTGNGAKALVTAAEDVGIESVWTVEHVLVPEGYESL